MTSVHDPFDSRIYEKQAITLASSGYRVILINPKISKKDGDIEFIKADIPKSRLLRMIFSSLPVYKAAIKTNADIFHLHDPELLKIGVKLMKKGHVIYDAHEDAARQILYKQWLPKWLRAPSSRWFERREKRLSRKLSYIICATEPIRDVFKAFGFTHVGVVRNYPIISKFINNNSVQKERAVCYVGGISLSRGILETVSSLTQTDVKLKLAGAFESDSLFKDASALPGWKNTEYFGFVDREKTSDIMASSIAGLIPLHPILNYLESLPIKMFEYMAAGIPMIVSDFPFWRELLEKYDCAVFVDPKDPARIANAINTLANDEALAQKMGENGRKAVTENFSWENEGEILLRIYEEINA